MGIVRKTKSIDVLLREFPEKHGAISVVELIKRNKSIMNKTTVYRVLDRLEVEGILHSFFNNEGIKCYAKCNGCQQSKHQDEHPHFYCVDCGKIDCLSFNIKIPSIQNREIINSQVLIQGRCEKCYA